MYNNPAHQIQINIKKHPVHHLTEEEKDNPYIVFEHLFDAVSLTEIRELLWKSFLSTITGTYPGELTLKEREDVVFVHERLKKLLDAAHLINEHVKLRGRYRHYEPQKEEEEEDITDDSFLNGNAFDPLKDN